VTADRFASPFGRVTVSDEIITASPPPPGHLRRGRDELAQPGRRDCQLLMPSAPRIEFAPRRLDHRRLHHRRIRNGVSAVWRVANSVRYQVEQMVGLPVASVGVHVQDLRVSSVD
jgi:hypothetical protein